MSIISYACCCGMALPGITIIGVPKIGASLALLPTSASGDVAAAVASTCYGADAEDEGFMRLAFNAGYTCPAMATGAFCGKFRPHLVKAKLVASHNVVGRRSLLVHA